MQPHFSNYLGIDKPLIILENYEATVGWFAVKWNETDFPTLKFGDLYNTNSTYAWKSGNNNVEKKIDYIFVWGQKKAMSDTANVQLQQYYTLIYSSSDENIKLYELTNQ